MNEHELHDAIRSALHDSAERTPGGGGLDASAAIAGARRRRRPKVAIVTGATAFAAVGILAIALPSVLQPISVVSTTGGAPMSDQIELSQTESADEQSAGSGDASIKRAPAEMLAMCESPMPFADLTGPVASMSGLTLEVIVDQPGAPASVASGQTLTAIARLTNPTATTITGATTTDAAGFLGVDGITRWHTFGGLGAVDVPFSLAPGASVDLPLTVMASSCTVDDDQVAYETGAFPSDLEPLPAGAATVMAAMDVLVDSADGPMLLDLVVAPAVTVQITE